MTIGKTLGTIVLLGSLGLGGCSTKGSPYNFRGTLGDEQVEFNSTYFLGLGDNLLSVKKPDSREIEYRDYNDDLKVDRIDVLRSGDPPLTYNDDDEISRLALAEGQAQFDSYLVRIKAQKEANALRSIR